jgi:flagellar capping protein FliD
LISAAQLQLNNQGGRLDTQISDMQARLAVERTALQAQYTAADQAMTTLKAQSGSLASMSSQTPNSLVTNG